MDKFVEKILNQKLMEGKLSLTEFNCIVNYIEKLIDKEIAKKPVLNKNWADKDQKDIYDENGYIDPDVCVCPRCKEPAIYDFEYGAKFDHCSDCGQRIDWSDEDDD